MPDLTDRDKQLLDFERQWWKFQGAKEAAVREQFGISLTRYAQNLVRLAGDPAALAYAPAVVNRLRRRTVRTTRTASG